MSSILSLLCLLVFVGVFLSWASSAQAQMVGGRKSAKGKWPFFAGLFFELSDEPHLPHCGAVVWDKDTLLTAAHCVLDEDGNPEEVELFKVYMGSNSWTEPIDIDYMFNIRKIIVHPHLKKESIYSYDIALIFLDRSIDFNGINKKAQRVNHPKPLDYLDTSKCVSMGWGIDNAGTKPTKLMEAVLPILDNKICKKRTIYFNPDYHLCAGYVRPTVRTGTCTGDSGGPLVCPQKAKPDKYSLVGIVSFGGKWPKCGRIPTYFTKIFEDWIASVHSKTGNVEELGEVSSWWRYFRSSWFGRLFSYKDFFN